MGDMRDINSEYDDTRVHTCSDFLKRYLVAKISDAKAVLTRPGLYVCW